MNERRKALFATILCVQRLQGGIEYFKGLLASFEILHHWPGCRLLTRLCAYVSESVQWVFEKEVVVT